ncbi:MAG: sensor histidine kinase [bacterium]
MTDAAAHDPVEPLFAHNAQLWLRVWITTQFAVLIVATYVVMDRAGGVVSLVASPSGSRLLALVPALVLYHVVGYTRYDWILQRTWAVLTFVPLCWVLVVVASGIHSAYGLLALGAILQGFIFLPFAWAAVILALVVAFLTFVSARQSLRLGRGTLLGQVGGILATGIMIGTVLLYIHRTNREAALRASLLRQLDEAQRDLAERARDAGVLEERQRLSRDIHDTLAQAFASVIKHLEAVELALGPGGDPAASADHAASLRAVLPHLQYAQSVSRSSLGEIRRVVLALRPTELTDAPLTAALGRIVAQWSEANTVEATFSAEPLPALQPDAEVIFLRATQESLSNVARHANASHVSITLASVDGLVLLTVEDNGRGFAHSETLGHEKLGLSGMRERVRRFGGHLLIDSTIGEGTSLTIAMPLSAIAASPPVSGRDG